MAAAVADTIARETKGGAELVELMLRVMRDEGQSMVDRIKAHSWLSERGMGKAPTVVETEHTVSLSDGTDLAELTAHELEQLEAGLRARALGAGEPDAPAEVVE
jgi:hypothetical protein